MADEFNPSIKDQDIEEILNFVREKNSEKYKSEEEKETLKDNKRERINNNTDIKDDVSKALKNKNKGQAQLMGDTTEVAAMFSEARPFADTTSVMISDVINAELDNKQSTAKSVAKSNSPMAYTRDDIDIKELFGNDLTYSKEIDISSIVSRIDSFQPIGDIFDLAIHEIEERESLNAENSDSGQKETNADDEDMTGNVTSHGNDGETDDEVTVEEESSAQAEDKIQQDDDITEPPDSVEDDVTVEQFENDSTDDVIGENEEVFEDEEVGVEDEETPQTAEQIDEDVDEEVNTEEEEQTTDDIISSLLMNNISDEKSENMDNTTYGNENDASVGVSQDTYGDLLISSLLSGKLGQIDIGETDDQPEDISSDIIEQSSQDDEKSSGDISEDVSKGTSQEDLTYDNDGEEEMSVTETDADEDEDKNKDIFDNLSEAEEQPQADVESAIENLNYSEESPIMDIFKDDNVNDDVNNNTADGINEELPAESLSNNAESIKSVEESNDAEITEDVEENDQEECPVATVIDDIDSESGNNNEDEKERKSKLFIILPIVSVLLVAIAVFAYCMLLPKDKQDNDINAVSSVAPPVESVVESTVESTVESSVPEVSSQLVEPEPEVYTGEYSRLTGLPIDDEDLNTRPIAVMINNIEYAQPLLGISKADIVYECIVEGGITRILAVFGTPSDVHTIGSVRSARPDFVYLADGLDAVYFHIGTSTQARDLLDTGIVTSFDLGYYSAWSWRDNYRMNALGYEHSLVTSGDNLASCLDSNGVRDTSDTDKGMKFGDKSPVLKGDKAKNLNVRFSSYKSTSFSYNSKKKVYTVEQFGSAQYDAEYGVDNTVTNVITICTDVYQIDDEGHMSFDTIGSGRGYYMSNGKIIDITWSKGSAGEPIRYYTSSGDELTMMRGKTYVCIVPNDADISYWS
ncbi:MAG: DUF3048 domain-containing protein [Acutalibacteraceae bacterium]